MLALALLVGMASPVNAFALDLDLSDATIDAYDGGLSVEKVEGPDHFVKEDSLAPGDTISRTYVIQNTYEHDYHLYLCAENPVSTPAELDLVNKIDLKLTLDGEVIYYGTVGGGVDSSGRDMINEIYLGHILMKSTHELKSEFYVWGPELSNEYQGAKAEVDWVFRATNDPSVTPAGNTPTDNPVRDSPGGKGLPKTGDLISLGLMVAVTLILAFMIIYAVKHSKKERYRE